MTVGSSGLPIHCHACRGIIVLATIVASVGVEGWAGDLRAATASVIVIANFIGAALFHLTRTVNNVSRTRRSADRSMASVFRHR
jgi:hypothetical protein